MVEDERRAVRVQMQEASPPYLYLRDVSQQRAVTGGQAGGCVRVVGCGMTSPLQEGSRPAANNDGQTASSQIKIAGRSHTYYLEHDRGSIGSYNCRTSCVCSDRDQSRQEPTQVEKGAARHSNSTDEIAFFGDQPASSTRWLQMRASSAALSYIATNDSRTLVLVLIFSTVTAVTSQRCSHCAF